MTFPRFGNSRNENSRKVEMTLNRVWPRCSVWGQTSTRVLKNSDSGCSKRPGMRDAREIDQRRRICRYVEARRSSATKQVSPFQQPVYDSTILVSRSDSHRCLSSLWMRSLDRASKVATVGKWPLVGLSFSQSSSGETD